MQSWQSTLLTILAIGAIVCLVERTTLFAGRSRLVRALIVGGLVALVVLVLNLLLPPA